MNPLVNEQSDREEANLYDISAVSRLTGLSAPNLRMWEKRYGLVEPRRSKSQRRLYSSEDIQRLTLLKTLVDQGHPIGSIANLRTSDLEERLQTESAIIPPRAPYAPGTPARVPPPIPVTPLA